MLNQKLITEELLLCQKKRKAIQTMASVLTEWDASLDKQEQSLKVLNEIHRTNEAFEKRFREAQLTLPGLGLPPAIEANTTARRRRRNGKKPDVQVIEEIFREYGPLHVSDLVPIANTRGVSFAGSKKPVLMARDKMFGSKRFRLFGNNVWGLPKQELPERYVKNGHSQEHADLIELR